MCQVYGTNLMSCCQHDHPIQRSDRLISAVTLTMGNPMTTTGLAPLSSVSVRSLLRLFPKQAVDAHLPMGHRA